MSSDAEHGAPLDGASTPPPPREPGADDPSVPPAPATAVFVARTTPMAAPSGPVRRTAPSARAGVGPALRQWLQAQQPRRYWRFLAGGVVGLFVVWYLIEKLQLGLIVPLYDLAFGLLLPATVVLYWQEMGEPEVLPRDVLRTSLISGAVMGLVSGVVLYGLLKLGTGALWDTVLVAVLKELLKVGAVVYLLRDVRLRREMDGLIVAFVAILGFSALETASYGYITYLQTNSGGYSGFDMFRPALANMDHVLSFQLLLQVLGDWVWTAILCAAIWRERGAATFRLTRGVGIAFGIVVVLHALWNYSFAHDWLKITVGGILSLETLFYIPIFTLLVAAVGLLVLSYFVQEARQRAALGSAAPPPPPLEQALPAYLMGLPQRLSIRT